ncbi:uroporphyrinogen-III C-methyltransferase [Chloroflexota bacterium]
MRTGKVYLVGAGPGDPGLISVKGLELLSKADVVIYDRLIDKELLNSVSSAVELICVGKAAGEHIKSQPEINQLLVAKAKKGKTVVRLKGGDPFVLGRGGEETEVLKENHIIFEVVPGVSSAVAVPAYAGIPVTRRGLASSFAVITGHEDPSKDSSSIAWEKLATGVDTLIFLMGMHHLPKIISELIKHGRSANTPIAIIKDGTTPGQQSVIGSLSDIIAKVAEQNLSSPAVIVVGEVVRLRDKLSWFDNRPLFGKRILVTRAHRQASKLSRLLSERGALPIELPAIEIEDITDTRELDQAILNIERYHWLVFTSANGVDSFFKRLRKLKLDSRALHGIKIGVIGPATADTLKTNGIIPDYLPKVYTSQGFIAVLKNQNVSGQRFLLPRADIANQELAEGICRLGAEVHNIATYRNIPTFNSINFAQRMLSLGEIDIITFTSSSTVSNLLTVSGEGQLTLKAAKVACIGPKTAETAVRAGLKVDIIASEHTIPGLVASIEQYFNKEI